MTKFLWHESSSSKGLTPITQVYGVCFKEGKVLVILEQGKKWNIPGGTPERGETPIQTLLREVDEEASVTVNYHGLKPVASGPLLR